MHLGIKVGPDNWRAKLLNATGVQHVEVYHNFKLVAAHDDAPLYAWLMVASAGARRSAAFLAVAPPVGLILLEEFFLGTEMVRSAIGNHFPHASNSSAIAFYMSGPNWGAVNYLSLVLGLVFTALALWVVVYLRRYRWEI